ncbi:sterigmatocystin 8-O-methyltransferase [Bisporella sp. PMI_857]|nr:sterigmatocystin 8-O-methyltransferase [Bisporella sp. PMI_857]
MADLQPTLYGLAAQITELTAGFTKFLHESHIAQPTFAASSPVSYGDKLSAEAFMIRSKLLDALNDLSILIQGPTESIFNYVHCVMPDAACLNTLNHFKVWNAVPLEGTASYKEIAERISLPEEVAKRLLQHAFNLRIFTETASGVAHTSRSVALAKQAGLSSLVSSVLDTSSTPLMVLNHALEKYTKGNPELTKEISETSFALVHAGKYRNSWDYLEHDGEGEKRGWRQKEFVQFMEFLNSIFRLEGIILDCYDWKSAGKATVVDVGGSAGHDSILLARKFPDLKFVVQDMPKVKPIFDENLPTDVKEQVSFVEHDLFEPQSTQADFYILKLILHDYPEPAAVNILRNLVPALKTGSRVILIEYIGKVEDGTEKKEEGPPMPRSIQQYGTATDLRMMALFNASERSADAYRNIFKLADERFDVVQVNWNPLTFFAVIEAVWKGE